MTQTALLDKLENDIRDLLERVRAEFANAEQSALTHRPNPKSWNASECFAHLNAYCDYYLPRMELAIHKAKARKWGPAAERKSNWFGRYSINAVNPANMEKNRRKTSKRFNFKDKTVRTNEIKAFLINYEILLRTLRNAREVDLNKAKVPFAQFTLFKLRLGDLLEFMVLHAQRHVIQAGKAKI